MNRLNGFAYVFLACLFAGSHALAQQQVVPPPAIQVNSPIVAINNSAGDHSLPHVSKDLAAYTDYADGAIHYYRFSTNVDTAIPGIGTVSVSDTLSDVNSGRVCFTRETPTLDFEVAVFDTNSLTTTVIDPHAGDLRLGCALGGNTLVYVDFGTGNGTGDIYAVDLSANPPTPVPISSSPLQEQNPNVSPDGNLVVWEQCPTASNCDVMKAVLSNGTWTVSPVVETSNDEENPDTDGTWIAYDAAVTPGFSYLIHFQPAAGGPDTQIVLPGLNINPSVSNGFIGFEGTIPPATTPDIYVYQIATNTLYQVTNTAGVSEQLNDISVLDNGDVRVVWAADDGPGGDLNIYGTTFTPIYPVNGFIAVSAGLAHTCGLRGTGGAECWGNNSLGQAPATRTATTGTFTNITAGALHTCALTSAGGVECWGNNLLGQAPAHKSPSTGTFTEVSAGDLHTCAVVSTGMIGCWGNNLFGQAPAARSARTGTFQHVTAGTGFTCGLRSDGVVECWGLGLAGQAPSTRRAAAGSFVQVSAGSLHTCASRLAGGPDDGVECWGSNIFGQAPGLTPGTFAQVSAGGAHTCGIKETLGSLVGPSQEHPVQTILTCWGNNSLGQAPATRAPTAGGGSSFTAVSAGSAHTCAINQGLFIECWGDNAFGQAPAVRH